MTDQLALDGLTPDPEPAPTTTCRHPNCNNPLPPGTPWIACPTCRLRTHLHSTWPCILTSHDTCTGTIGDHYGDQRRLQGQPCGCRCHPTTDPNRIDPDLYTPRINDVLHDLEAGR